MASDSAATDVQNVAREAARCFETARRATGDTATGPREDGDEYVRVRDGSPEWVTELVRAGHQDGSDGGMLPEDYRYRFVREAVDAIAEADDDADLYEIGVEYADDLPDATHELTSWLGSMASRYGYVDESISENGVHTGEGVLDLIRRGMAAERSEVYDRVLGFLTERAGVRL